MFTKDTVTIVTAATGHRSLPRCLNSVQEQTFAGVEHLVVIDGEEHRQKVEAIVDAESYSAKPLKLVSLPHPTGKNLWCGHRIYGAMTFLINTEFVCFLDEDNWIDPDHVASLVAAVRQTPGAKWAFSLRKIVDGEGNFVTLDNCESLGSLHHVFNNPADIHIDTNCYLLNREVAVTCVRVWYAPTRRPEGLLEPDRALCRMALHHFQPVATNRKHTVNYAVSNRPDSINADYFLSGNKVMHLAYPNGLPWEKTR